MRYIYSNLQNTECFIADMSRQVMLRANINSETPLPRELH